MASFFYALSFVTILSKQNVATSTVTFVTIINRKKKRVIIYCNNSANSFNY